MLNSSCFCYFFVPNRLRTCCIEPVTSQVHSIEKSASSLRLPPMYSPKFRPNNSQCLGCAGMVKQDMLEFAVGTTEVDNCQTVQLILKDNWRRALAAARHGTLPTWSHRFDSICSVCNPRKLDLTNTRCGTHPSKERFQPVIIMSLKLFVSISRKIDPTNQNCSIYKRHIGGHGFQHLPCFLRRLTRVPYKH